ncbi:hypothetical protein [Xanthobacter sediminis]
MQQHSTFISAQSLPGLRLILLALALGLGAPPVSAATTDGKVKAPKRTEAPKDNRVWLMARADDTTVLRFGLPGAADPAFAVSCQPGAGLLQFTVELKSPKTPPGEGVALTLAAGKRKLELAASTFRGASDGLVVAEAAVTLDERVLDLFSDGETLSVRTPGTTASFPLAGAKLKLADFRRACQVRR